MECSKGSEFPLPAQGMPGDVGQDSAHLKLEQSKEHLGEELLFHISKDKNTRGLFWVRDVLLGTTSPLW